MAASQDRQAGRGVLAAACVSAFVVNANTSAVTVLLPSISKDIGAPIAQLQWAVTGYSLVGAAVIVTSCALGDVLGRRKVFLGDHREAGESASAALAAGLGSSALMMAIWSAAGIALIVLMRRLRLRRTRAVDRAAAAAAIAHTVPTEPTPSEPATREPTVAV
jgi:MFS family permease